MIGGETQFPVLSAWIVPRFQGLLNQSNLEKTMPALEHDYFVYPTFIPYVDYLYSHICLL
jgi:hypothetical protein